MTSACWFLRLVVRLLSRLSDAKCVECPSRGPNRVCRDDHEDARGVRMTSVQAYVVRPPCRQACALHSPGGAGAAGLLVGRRIPACRCPPIALRPTAGQDALAGKRPSSARAISLNPREITGVQRPSRHYRADGTASSRTAHRSPVEPQGGPMTPRVFQTASSAGTARPRLRTRHPKDIQRYG